MSIVNVIIPIVKYYKSVPFGILHNLEHRSMEKSVFIFLPEIFNSGRKSMLLQYGFSMFVCEILLLYLKSSECVLQLHNISIGIKFGCNQVPNVSIQSG